MKKLYFVETNGYNMIISRDEDGCRYLTETNDFPYITNMEESEKEQKALSFLESIEDDNEWEEGTWEQLVEEFDNVIIAEIVK